MPVLIEQMASGHASSGNVTIHLLDGFHGIPADQVRIDLHCWSLDHWVHVKTVKTLPSGRTETPLLPSGDYAPGRYQLLVHLADYFARFADTTVLSDPPYLTIVPFHFNFASWEEHYHIPIVMTPWGYTHFRGS